MKNKFLLIAAVALAFAYASCSDNSTTGLSEEQIADMVVYGTIYTVEDDAPQAEAFAVKDGKYVYVGSVDGAKAYVGEKTTVVNHRGNGMITPGFADCHSHYIMSNGMDAIGKMSITEETTAGQLMEMIREEYKNAKKEGRVGIFGFGWSYNMFKLDGVFPTLAQLDEACPDIPLYVADDEGHKGFANTACLINAGILSKNGELLIKVFKGGEIVVDAKGHPTGLLLEQAGTYCRLHGLDFMKLLDKDKTKVALINALNSLHSKGYVAVLDGWSNYFGNTLFYEVAKELDENDRLNLSFGMAYEIDSSIKDLDGELQKAFATNAYSSKHVNPRFVKMFVDGTVDSHTGYIHEPYIDKEGGVGAPIWMEDEFAANTAKVNAQNFTMHAHAMGDKAVHLAVNGYVRSGKKELRNTLVHVRNVLEEDYAVMAANNIVVTSGVIWHYAREIDTDFMKTLLPDNYVKHMYPIKSFFDHGVVMTTHSDFPAVDASSELPMYIMELGVTGVLPEPVMQPHWPKELVTRQQMLKAMTINGAYQMHNEKERGSIKVGKYADFVIIDKDVMNDSYPANLIHTANVTYTFFEGKQVYPKK